MVWEGVKPPTEPAGYDPNNKYADPVLYYKHREAKVAAEYVKVAEAKVRHIAVCRLRRNAAVVAWRLGDGQAAADAAAGAAAGCPDQRVPQTLESTVACDVIAGSLCQHFLLLLWPLCS
jgi:hypothetical protein